MAHDETPAHTSRRRGAGRAGGAEGSRGSREAILTVATDLMAERGFAATSIGSICSATGLAPTAVYWHFGSKDGLLAAIVQHSVERWYRELAGAMVTAPTEGDGPPPVPLVTDLDRFFVVMADAYRHSPQALRLMLWLGLDRGHPDKAVRTAVQQARRQAIDLIAGSIGKVLGAPDGLPPLQDAYDQLARLLLVQLDGIFVSHEVDDDEDRLDELFALAHTALVAAGTEVLSRAVATIGTGDPASEQPVVRRRRAQLAPERAEPEPTPEDDHS